MSEAITPDQPDPFASAPQESEDARKAYRESVDLITSNQPLKVDLAFDTLRGRLLTDWRPIRKQLETTGSTTPHEAVGKLFAQCGAAEGTVIALARTDASQLSTRLRDFLEFTVNGDSDRSGYPTINSVPHTIGGALYMWTAATALRFGSWKVLKHLLADRIEWTYQSGRPLYGYGFTLSYFFHPEIFDRNAARAHDFYRQRWSKSRLASDLGISEEQANDLYIQVQMLMTFRVAQLNLQGESLRIWPDFGRWYSSRVLPVFERSQNDTAFGAGLAACFGESLPAFLKAVPERLKYIQKEFWGNSGYFWESIDSWSPSDSKG